MTKSNEVLSLVIERYILAAPEKVFAAWTDKAQVARWFAPSNDFTVVVPTLDAQVGGTYRFEMTNPEGQTHIAVGEYVEVSKPNKLVFTWSWEGGDAGMLVTLDFARADQGTKLTLTHDKFPDVSSRDHHNEGWNGCLAQLENLIGAACHA